MKHTVKSGETLSAIAEKYKTTVSAIRKANSSLIKDVNLIQIGWVLTIPEETKTSPTNTSNEEIGKAFKDVVKDIENLSSYKRFLKVFNGDSYN